METLIGENKNEKGIDLNSISDMAQDLEMNLRSLEAGSDMGTCLEITDEMQKEELAKLKDLNYIELMRYHQSIKSQLNELKSSKELAESLLVMKSQAEKIENSLGDKIAFENGDDNLDLDFNEIDEFLKNYDSSVEKINEVKKACEARIEEYDGIPKTSTYMTNAMLEILNKNLSSIGDDPKYKSLRISYENMKEIYENRSSTAWLVQKLPDKKIILQRWLKSFKADLKAGKKDVFKTSQKSLSKVFCQVFSVDQMKKCENYLREIVNGDNEILFLVDYALYLIYTDKKVKERGQFKWIEMFYLNILDVLDDKYDFEGGEEKLKEEIKKVIETVRSLVN